VAATKYQSSTHGWAERRRLGQARGSPAAKHIDEATDDIVSDRRVDLFERAQTRLVGSTADPHDRLTLLLRRLGTDEPANNQLDEFITAAMRFSQHSVSCRNIRHS
jgi:hypothetical protein